MKPILRNTLITSVILALAGGAVALGALGVLTGRWT